MEKMKALAAKIAKQGKQMHSLLVDHHLATTRVKAAEVAERKADKAWDEKEQMLRAKYAEELAAALQDVNKPLHDARAELGTAQQQLKGVVRALITLNKSLMSAVTTVESTIMDSVIT